MLQIKRPRLELNPALDSNANFTPNVPSTSQSKSIDFNQPTSLNRDLRHIFASYYLLSIGDQIQFSYYDSKNENSYLIGETKVTDVLRIYFLNKFWCNSTKFYLRSLSYSIVLECNGGRRLKYPCIGRLFTDSSSLKYSRASQNFLLLKNGSLSYAIRCDQLDYLFEFKLLNDKASALYYSSNTNGRIRHTKLPYLQWFENLEELDFAPVFPPKSLPILYDLLNINKGKLKRLYLPNFLNIQDLKLNDFELLHLKKCFMTFLIGNQTEEPIHSFLPYFSLNTKTLEFNMNSLTCCVRLPPNFKINPKIENLELSFKRIEETISETFYSWIDSLSGLQTNLKKLIFIAHLFYVAKGENNSLLGLDFFTRNHILLNSFYQFNNEFREGKHRTFGFDLMIEFDVRCKYKEIRPNLRVDGQLITIQLIINGQQRNSGIQIAFKRDNNLIRDPQKLDLSSKPTKFSHFQQQISNHWLSILELLD